MRPEGCWCWACSQNKPSWTCTVHTQSFYTLCVCPYTYTENECTAGLRASASTFPHSSSIPALHICTQTQQDSAESNRLRVSSGWILNLLTIVHYLTMLQCRNKLIALLSCSLPCFYPHCWPVCVCCMLHLWSRRTILSHLIWLV